MRARRVAAAMRNAWLVGSVTALMACGGAQRASTIEPSPSVETREPVPVAAQSPQLGSAPREVVEEARALMSYLQADNGNFESVGLVPPIVEPGSPDYDSLRTYMQHLRENVAQGLPVPTVTDPGASTSG